MKLIPLSPPSAQHGVVLVEAMVAILLFSVGVLAISGLQASMLQNASDTKYRTEASYIAQQIVGQMWVAPTITDFVKDNVDISSQLPGGRLSVVGTQTNVYQIVVGWTAPGETATTELAAPCNVMSVAHCFSTLATITPLIITP
jgi:type IV pilus assembly protein PilV